MSNFTIFERQYGNSCAEAINNLNQYENTADNAFLHKAQRNLDEVQDLVEQMEFEAASNKDQRKTAITYKKEFLSIENRWKRCRENVTRNKLLSKNQTYVNEAIDENPISLSVNDKQNLLDTDRLTRGSRKLEDGYRIALDTEEHGRDILNELQREREVLERSKNRLHHANTMLSSSTDIVTRMYRHVVQDRVILYVIIGVIGLVVLIVIFSKIT